MVRNTDSIARAARLPYWWITVKVIKLEKVTLSDFLLTDGLRITSILFLVETTQCKQFRCIYLKNKKIFLIFSVHFSNLHQILNIFKQRWPSQLMYLRNYELRKTWLDKCLKSPVSEDSLTDNIRNGPKHWLNVTKSTFIILIYQCDGNSVQKSHS